MFSVYFAYVNLSRTTFTPPRDFLERLYVSLSILIIIKYPSGLPSDEHEIALSDYLELEELPDTDEPVYILGKQYDIKTG